MLAEYVGVFVAALGLDAQVGLLVANPFHEFEADAFGLKKMAEAGYEPIFEADNEGKFFRGSVAGVDSTCAKEISALTNFETNCGPSQEQVADRRH